MGSVGFFFIVMYPFLYYYSRKPERYAGMNKWRGILGYVSSAFAGIFYRYSFETKIDWSRPYIICPNHTSNLDITAVALLNKSTFAFLGKEELLDNFVTKLFFKTIDIPVNRESKIASFRAFKKADEYLKKGISLAIFPEGTISHHYPPRLQDFKNGPFRLAIEHQIPIIPVTLVNVWKKMWDDGSQLGSRPGICDIRVHQPIETRGLSIDDVDQLREKVFNIINSELEKHEA
jgi:1-acyl-sn-glycerol-3-phosphate acyltransferase